MGILPLEPYTRFGDIKSDHTAVPEMLEQLIRRSTTDVAHSFQFSLIEHFPSKFVDFILPLIAIFGVVVIDASGPMPVTIVDKIILGSADNRMLPVRWKRAHDALVCSTLGASDFQAHCAKAAMCEEL